MKPRIAIIGGSGFSELLESLKSVKVKTKYGNPSDSIEVGIFSGKTVAFLPRHGKKRNIPPHMINHRANIFALKKLGVEKIIGVTSVGSLKKKISPPCVFVPNDYINLWNIQTYYEKKIAHVTPGIDENLRKIVIEQTKKVGAKIFEGIYVQTTGPRLETKAEINLLKNYADVVGMNMAAEATLSKELGLRYVNISSVDNYANGIIKESLTFEQILQNARENSEEIKKILKNVVKVIK
ncbi:MAG: MTAP family purine nucleoside phosphorylase [Candidatus Thermoplasmatota archaeon]|nr:MTAP family purine nucleoside phosphorylase [Candidatus Thermoplasmatota archaeon]